MSLKIPPYRLCIQSWCILPDFGFTNITLSYFVEDTVHEILFLFKLFLAIITISWQVISFQDLLTVMCCGCDQEISFEGFKIFLIIEYGVLRYFPLDAFLESMELVCILIGFIPGVLLGLSLISCTRYGACVLIGIFNSPCHGVFPVRLQIDLETK